MNSQCTSACTEGQEQKEIVYNQWSPGFRVLINVQGQAGVACRWWSKFGELMEPSCDGSRPGDTIKSVGEEMWHKELVKNCCDLLVRFLNLA